MSALISLLDETESSFPQLSREDALAGQLFNHRGVVGGQRKALVVGRLADRVLTAHERIDELDIQLDSRADFNSVLEYPNYQTIYSKVLTDLQGAQGGVAGIGPALSEYFLILVGWPGVKADIQLQRFTDRCLGRAIRGDELRNLYREAINELNSTRPIQHTLSEVDHLVWLFQRRDPIVSDLRAPCISDLLGD